MAIFDLILVSRLVSMILMLFEMISAVWRQLCFLNFTIEQRKQRKKRERKRDKPFSKLSNHSIDIFWTNISCCATMNTKQTFFLIEFTSVQILSNYQQIKSNRIKSDQIKQQALKRLHGKFHQWWAILIREFLEYPKFLEGKNTRKSVKSKQIELEINEHEEE